MDLQNEVWCIVNEAPDYQVSNLGNLRKLKSRLGVLEYTPIKDFQDKDGYPQASLQTATGRRKFRTNRLVCTAFQGKAPAPNYVAAHKNHIRNDNRAENLYWATPLRNNQDIDEAERRPKGARHYKSRISETLAKSILQDTGTVAELSIKFDLPKQYIRNIRNRHTWKHL